MLELALRFRKPVNFFLYAGIFACLCAWSYWRLSRKKRLQLTPFIVLNFMLGLAWACLSEVNHDDTAFLHFSWQVAQGLSPYHGFWEHHSCLFSLLLAPVMKLIPPDAAVLDAARVFSGLLLCLNTWLGWVVSKRVWGGRASLSLYLLVVSGMVVAGHYFILRPDLLMISLLLSLILISLDIPGPRIFPSFCAGVVFALSASLITKQYFLVFLAPAAIFLGKKRGRGEKLFCYGLGLMAGFLPLLSYLAASGLLAEFLDWTIGFNKRLLMVTVNFPMPVMAAGVWGGYALYRTARNEKGRPECHRAYVLLIALFLSTLSSLTATNNYSDLYCLGLWFFICAASVSGSGALEAFYSLRSRKAQAAIAGCLLAFMIMPNLLSVWRYRRGDYLKTRNAVRELLNYAYGDTCLAILPVHPIFVHDATRLYSGWQYRFVSDHPEVNKDILDNGGICENILRLKPAVVMARYGKREFALDMYQKKLLTSVEYSRLIRFLEEGYTRKKIGVNTYYIRNDRL